MLLAVAFDVLHASFSVPDPGTISALSPTATLVMPSLPLRMDTPCAGQTSLSSSFASVDKSSSANPITQTWVSTPACLQLSIRT